MSKTLTQYYKNFFTKKRKPLFKTILIVFLTCLLAGAIIVCVLINDYKTKPYGEKHFYILYSGIYLLSSQANEQCTKVSDKGGAGIIYNIENKKYIVVNIYFSESEAMQVKSQIVSQFSDTNIIKITAPKIDKKVCKEIEKYRACKLLYSTFYNFCAKLEKMVFDLDTSVISNNTVYKKVMQTKQQLSDLSLELKQSNSSVSEVLLNSCLLLTEQINVFFDSAFVANNVAKNLKKLYANAVLEFVDMCKTIK